MAVPSGAGGCDMNERKPVKSGSKMQTPDAIPKHAVLSRQIQDRIGQQLRAMYNDVVAQGVPDRFTELLKKLDHQGQWGQALNGQQPIQQGQRSLGARRYSRHLAEPARVRDLTVRQCRPGRRSRAGDAVARTRQHQLVRARDQPASVAVHNSAQPVPVRISQAPARGRRQRRPLCRNLEDPSRAEQPDRVRGISAGAGTSCRPISAKR